MFIEADQSGVSPDKTLRIQRPGLVEIASFPLAPVRGVFAQEGVFNGARFGVGGGALYSLPSTPLGAVPGTENVAFAAPIGPSGTPILATLSGGMVYLWTGSSLLTLPMPLGEYVEDIDTINGYLLCYTTSGRFYWMEPGTVTIDPLNFATTESAPDGGVAVRRLVDELIFFGRATVEVWQTTGNPDAPFARAAGRQFDRGALNRNTVRRFDNSILWVGDDLSVYRLSNVPGDTGDNAMSERLRLATAAPTAWTFGLDDHKFYVLTIPGQGTFAFDPSTKQWCEFASEGYTTWRAWVGTQIGSTILAGDMQSGKVWALQQGVNTDGGNAIRRTISGTIAVSGTPVRNDSLSIGVGASADCVIRVRWRDGNEAYPAFAEELQVRAPVDVVSLYRLGQAEQPFRTLEIEVLDNVTVSIFGAVANAAWQ